MDDNLLVAGHTDDDESNGTPVLSYVAAPLAVYGAFKAGQSVVRRIRAARAAKKAATTVNVTPITETE